MNPVRSRDRYNKQSNMNKNSQTKEKFTQSDIGSRSASNGMNPELEKQLVEKQQALRELRFGATGGKSANVKASRNLRKEIAKILTALYAK